MRVSDDKMTSATRVDDLMWKVNKLLTKKKNTILDEFELTCLQYDILSAIYHASNHNGIIQIVLSEKTQFAPMTTSIVLRCLEKRGLIKRDRRSMNPPTVEAQLTKTGKELYGLAQLKVDNMRRDLFRGLDQKQFKSQLIILSDKLNEI